MIQLSQNRKDEIEKGYLEINKEDLGELIHIVPQIRSCLTTNIINRLNF